MQFFNEHLKGNSDTWSPLNCNIIQPLLLKSCSITSTWVNDMKQNHRGLRETIYCLWFTDAELTIKGLSEPDASVQRTLLLFFPSISMQLCQWHHCKGGLCVSVDSWKQTFKLRFLGNKAVEPGALTAPFPFALCWVESIGFSRTEGNRIRVWLEKAVLTHQQLNGRLMPLRSTMWKKKKKRKKKTHHQLNLHSNKKHKVEQQERSWRRQKPKPKHEFPTTPQSGRDSCKIYNKHYILCNIPYVAGRNSDFAKVAIYHG